jgi:hypothetical protein
MLLSSVRVCLPVIPSTLWMSQPGEGIYGGRSQRSGWGIDGVTLYISDLLTIGNGSSVLFGIGSRPGMLLREGVPNPHR